MSEAKRRHGHPDFLVCVSGTCTEHRHRRHPGMGHCGSCLDEQNEGYSYGDFTFLSASTGEDRCCCRDNRIGLQWRPTPDSTGARE